MPSVANSEDLSFLTPAEGHPADTCAATSGGHRLIVLIPEISIDVNHLRHAMTQLNADRSHELVLLGSDSRGGVSGHSKFIRLAIDLRAQGWRVTSHLLNREENWTSAVRRIAEAGDLIACHAEYEGERLRREISSDPGLSVCVLSGVYPTRTQRWLRWVARAIFEIIPLAIIIGTFWFQVQISSHTSGAVNTIAIMISLIFEFGLIFVWSLFLP
jgi:hypothetical protein